MNKKYPHTPYIKSTSELVSNRPVMRFPNTTSYETVSSEAFRVIKIVDKDTIILENMQTGRTITVCRVYVGNKAMLDVFQCSDDRDKHKFAYLNDLNLEQGIIKKYKLLQSTNINSDRTGDLLSDITQ